MKTKSGLGGRAALLIGISVFAAQSYASEPTEVPQQPEFPAQGKITYVPRDSILEFKALPEYKEPSWVTEKFVKTGKLPSVAERLPKEPMVFKTGNAPDGVGVYGDTMRHVIGGRPEGWNYSAGQTQGWGGIDIGMSECLTRTAPLFQIEAKDMEPLPNLAKSWAWSDDGKVLTMKLIEGAKWSDGDPFDSEDIMFYWEDNVLDPNVTPLNAASPETFGTGTTLKAIDKYTIEWTFKESFPRQHLYAMAYGTFCPGPAHILKTKHPKYNKDMTYEQYKNGWPADFMNMPVMGAWAPVNYRPDDIIVLRRNPYYWKVDEAGNQLPYLNELHYKLSTWADRDVQTIAGSADFSNLEQPENFVESLKRAAEETAPARLAFGPRVIGYNLYLNFSGNGWGEPDARGQAIRELNRDLDFRKAVTMALDRKSLGESLVKGPFTAIYPGGLSSATSFYDRASTVYYPFDVEGAKVLLEKLGLKDTDGNGFVNFPADKGGKDVEIVMLGNSDYTTDKSLAEGVIGQMEKLGIRVVLNSLDGKQFDASRYSGRYDWMVMRNEAERASVVQDTPELAATGPRTSDHHRAPEGGQLDLMPFEQELVDTVNKFIASSDDTERANLMKQYQKVVTANLDTIGLTEYPGALIINKRFANIPVGAPIFMFNWAEDTIIRERVFVPEGKQADYELFKETLPGKPGVGEGPAS